MAKVSGKVLAINIMHSGARVIVGEISHGDADIKKYFTVAGIDAYFERVGAEYECTSVGGLVSSICTELKNQKVPTKKILLCSDMFRIDTTVEDASGGGLLDALTRKRGDGAPSRPASDPSKIKSKLDWGNLVVGGKTQKIDTVTVGDKYFLRSLADEFEQFGFEVISIVDTNTALMHLYRIEAARFDSQGKIVFDVGDNDIHIIKLFKDIPISIDQLALPGGDMSSFVGMQIKGSESEIGRNPMVFICGEQMSDCTAYNNLIENLGDSANVYDLFEHPEMEYDGETGLPCEPFPLTADYTACIGMLLSTLGRKATNVLPSKTLTATLKQNSKVIFTGLLVVASLTFVFSAASAAHRAYQLYQIDKSPVNVAGLESQLSQLNTNKQLLNDTINTLTKSDMTILQVIDFVNDNQSEQVHVISIDTRDMLSTTDVSVGENSSAAVKENASSTDTATKDQAASEEGTSASDVVSDVVSGVSSAIDLNRENIVIRGYAKSGAAAITYYDRLFNLGLDYDPTLNGVEKYTLPDGDEVFIFEIEVGGA